MGSHRHIHTYTPTLPKTPRISATIKSKFNFKNIFSDIVYNVKNKIDFVKNSGGRAPGPPGSATDHIMSVLFSAHKTESETRQKPPNSHTDCSHHVAMAAGYFDIVETHPPAAEACAMHFIRIVSCRSVLYPDIASHHITEISRLYFSSIRTRECLRCAVAAAVKLCSRKKHYPSQHVVGVQF